MKVGSTVAYVLGALFCAGAANAQSVVGAPQIVASFDASKLEAPEGVAIDSQGNRFVSLALTGEVRKIAADGTQSTFATFSMGAAPLTPCFNFVPIMGALAIDHQGNLYLPVDSCDLSVRGIYKIAPDGSEQLLANISGAILADGIALHDGNLYVADTGQQVVLKLPASGGAVQVWKDDPLLKKDPNAPAIYPGPNGIQYFGGQIYVSVSGGPRMVTIPIEPDGSAGPVSVFAAGVGCDDFDFDVFGDIYCTTDPFETLVLIRPDGSQQTLLTGSDGLDGPTAAVFGRTAGQIRQLYVTNANFPFFPGTGHGPSLMLVPFDVPGMPRP